MKTRQIRPHKSDGWKVEPLPPKSRQSLADFSASQLIVLLAAAHRRIGILEMQIEELQAGAVSKLTA